MDKEKPPTPPSPREASGALSDTDAMIGMPPTGWADRGDVMAVVRDIHRALRDQKRHSRDGDGDL